MRILTVRTCQQSHSLHLSGFWALKKACANAVVEPSKQTAFQQLLFSPATLPTTWVRSALPASTATQPFSVFSCQSLKPIITDVETLHWVRMRTRLEKGSAHADFCCSGLAWHTDDQTLRSKFEEFGEVQEAVCQALCRMLALLISCRLLSRIATQAAAVDSDLCALPTMPKQMRQSRP